MTTRTVLDLAALAVAIAALGVALWLLDHRTDRDVPVRPAMEGTVSPAPEPGDGP